MKRNDVIMHIVFICAVCFLAFTAFAPILYADIETGFPGANGQKIEDVTNAVDKIWGTVIHIVQILAFAAIIFCGIRYMFASADQKADIKQGLIYIVIGAILVFATSTVVSIIVGSAKNLKQ